MTFAVMENGGSKNMNEYIKKEDVLTLIDTGCLISNSNYNKEIKLINELPSTDVEPVRHGYWERDGHHIRCSECGTYFCITDREGDSFPINYCPCCGAKMDKGVAHNKEQ